MPAKMIPAASAAKPLHRTRLDTVGFIRSSVFMTTSQSTRPALEHVRESLQNSNSSGPEREHIGAQSWIGGGQSDHVPSPRRSGDQANYSRSFETRDSVCAHIHSTRLPDGLSIEQH